MLIYNIREKNNLEVFWIDYYGTVLLGQGARQSIIQLSKNMQEKGKEPSSE